MELIVEEKSLTPDEQTRLQALEAVIRENLKAWYAVGIAMIEIRDLRLYRNDEGRTWEGYCRENFDMSHQHADRQISAAKVIENLTPIGVKDDGTVNWELLPANESQARELAILEPEEQQAVWKGFIEGKQAVAEGTPVKVTAKAIKEAVKGLKGGQLTQAIDKAKKDVQPRKKAERNRESEAFILAWETLLEQIEDEQRIEWKNTSRKVVFNSLLKLASVIGECGDQTMRDKKITFRSHNIEKLMASGFGVYRKSSNNLMIEQLGEDRSWLIYGEYETEEQRSEAFQDLLLDPNTIQA